MFSIHQSKNLFISGKVVGQPEVRLSVLNPAYNTDIRLWGIL